MTKLKPHFLSANDHEMLVDYHVHSNYNDDAQGTVEECIQASLAKGLTSIAITNHVWKTTKWIANFINEARYLRTKYKCNLLIGSEAKIINMNGEVDIPSQYLEDIELLMGALHHLPTNDDYVWLRSESLSSSKVAEVVRDATLNLISRNEVNVVAHPLALYYQKHATSFPVEFLEDIVKAASMEKIALEVHNSKHPLPKEVFRRLIHLCVRYEVPMCIGSDAHSPSEIGNLNYATIQRTIDSASRGKADDQ